ncbi:hypothetical protein QL989_18980 [Pseudoalteromonas sp. APC 3224]|uniref:hypothetical protein n=1 Tax=Pseudoalteromonas sp. APC 3224 TaxID=3035203 RepID=UPI0025B2ABA7|nr:hypothetical protein [Pseudoalteromonas sp. APC 3224]MDN3487427.1 hypothetical protein [Pseudoalteromonas sp. APC 3224]
MKNLKMIFVCILLIFVGVILSDALPSVLDGSQSILCIIDKYLKPVFFLLATSLTIHLGYKKISNDVRVNFALNDPSSSYLPAQITSLVLMNQKDKPVSIQEILVQFPDSRAMVLKKYNSPLILGPLSSEKIEVPQYSKIFIGGDKNYEPDFENSVIKLQTPSVYISCTFPKFKDKLIGASIGRKIRRFSGHVYNDEVKYALKYKYNKKTLVAFILHNSQFCNEWNFIQPNFRLGFSVEEIVSIDELNFIDSWRLYELNEKSQNLICVSYDQFDVEN